MSFLGKETWLPLLTCGSGSCGAGYGKESRAKEPSGKQGSDFTRKSCVSVRVICKLCVQVFYSSNMCNQRASHTQASVLFSQSQLLKHLPAQPWGLGEGALEGGGWDTLGWGRGCLGCAQVEKEKARAGPTKEGPRQGGGEMAVVMAGWEGGRRRQG